MLTSLSTSYIPLFSVTTLFVYYSISLGASLEYGQDVCLHPNRWQIIVITYL